VFRSYFFCRSGGLFRYLRPFYFCVAAWRAHAARPLQPAPTNDRAGQNMASPARQESILPQAFRKQYRVRPFAHPLIRTLLSKFTTAQGGRSMPAKNRPRWRAAGHELWRRLNQLPSMVLITLDIGRAVSRPPPHLLEHDVRRILSLG
jgi:hypothetical protein